VNHSFVGCSILMQSIVTDSRSFSDGTVHLWLKIWADRKPSDISAENVPLSQRADAYMLLQCNSMVVSSVRSTVMVIKM
jgi:hypothetical protein